MPSIQIEKLLIKSQEGSLNAFKKDGSYNADHKLSQEQIEIAALIQVDGKASEECYINGFSLRDGAESIGVQELFETADPSLLDAAFNLTDSINAANSGKPAFFVIEDLGHYVTVALVPDKEEPFGISVQYINSILKPDQALKAEQALLIAELNDIPQNYEDSERIEDLQVKITSISDAIEEQERMANVGKNFAQSLLEYLQKKEGIKLVSNLVEDRSLDQQLGNCCGLSVSSNIAAITNGVSLFKPKNSDEKIQYYEDLGTRIFSYIRSGELVSPTLKADLSYRAEDWSKGVAAIEKVYGAKTKPLAEQIAGTIIENHDLFKDRQEISKADLILALQNSNSLDEQDRNSLKKLFTATGDKQYSKEEIIGLISGSSFVKEQVLAEEQVEHFKNNSNSSSLSPSPTPQVSSKKTPAQSR